MKLRLVLPSPCPHNCVYCYKEGVFSNRQDKLDASDFIFLIKIAKKVGFDELKLTGGEPTNYLELIELIKAARDSNYSNIRMTTIGIKLADINFCRSLRNSGLDGVTISVNSFNPETYKKMMGASEKDFELMKEGLKNAIEIFGHSVTLNTVLTRWNLKEILELIEYASKNGLGVKVLEMLDESGIAPKDIYVSLDEFKKEIGFDEGAMINPTRELIRHGGARVYLVNSCCARKECDTCRKGYQVVRTTSDGKLKTCISHELDEIDSFKPIKNRDEKRLKDILLKTINKFKNNNI